MNTNSWYVGMECKVQDREGRWYKGTIKAIKRGRARVVTKDEGHSFWIEAGEKHRILAKREGGGHWVENDFGLKGYQKAKTRGELLCVAIHNRQLKLSVETTSQSENIIWYTVRVDTGKHVWESDHRYSEFRKLYEILTFQNFIPLEITMPKKTWSFHEKSNAVTFERTIAFDEFLNKVVRVENAEYCMELINFLTIHPGRDVRADIKDVNKAYEMGLMSFRQSKLLESRPDLRELLFPASDDEFIQTDSSTSSSRMGPPQKIPMLDMDAREKYHRQSCMEQIFKEYEKDFSLKSSASNALANDMVTSEREELQMSFSGLSEFDEIEFVDPKTIVEDSSKLPSTGSFLSEDFDSTDSRERR